MARTKILVPPEKQCGYTSVIVSYSTGIDSTGAIYWATQNFAPEKIFLLYCDTGAEYSVNEALFCKGSGTETNIAESAERLSVSAFE